MIQFPAIISKITTMVDRSIKITLETPELESKSMAEIFDLRDQEGWCLLDTHRIKQEHVPEAPELISKDISKSKRLRASLYVLWQSQGSIGLFDNFYNLQMEKIIEGVKSKLPTKR